MRANGSQAATMRDDGRADACGAVLARLPARRTHTWAGASGRVYPHTVHPLRECPHFPNACYVLARRDETGRCEALCIDRAEHGHGSRNLAEVRFNAARLGANEVHLLGQITNAESARLAVLDLRAAQFATLSREADRLGAVAPPRVAGMRA